MLLRGTKQSFEVLLCHSELVEKPLGSALAKSHNLS